MLFIDGNEIEIEGDLDTILTEVTKLLYSVVTTVENELQSRGVGSLDKQALINQILINYYILQKSSRIHNKFPLEIKQHFREKVQDYKEENPQPGIDFYMVLNGEDLLEEIADGFFKDPRIDMSDFDLDLLKNQKKDT